MSRLPDLVLKDVKIAGTDDMEDRIKAFYEMVAISAIRAASESDEKCESVGC